MVVTEKEASNYICPLLNESCKGTGCMFWRWVADKVFNYMDLPSRTAGYCGNGGSIQSFIVEPNKEENV